MVATRASRSPIRSEPGRCHGAGRQAERAAHLRERPSMVGRRAVFCLAGEMPQALQKHRAVAQHQPPVRHKAFLALLLRGC